jgi:hypothetical protein
MCKVKCIALDCDSTMFTIGKDYTFTTGKTGVLDNQGSIRYLAEANCKKACTASDHFLKTLRKADYVFSIANTAGINNGRQVGRVFYAHFKQL